ncbi:MAG TPA: hypothetical protein PKJ14_07375 [Candidatus Cloacimonadota bacterium]|nr:hypothetical protein [Candidatus Cloacimonadota bacterium]HQL15334.1 hypothetical protein [Candidatus Cloacimonadota bacterium]
MEFIVCDNGTEFRIIVMFKWPQDNNVEYSFTASGKSQQNAFEKTSMASSEKNVLT